MISKNKTNFSFSLDSNNQIYNIQKNMKKEKKPRMLFNIPSFKYNYFEYDENFTKNQQMYLTPSFPIDKDGVITGQRLHNIENFVSPVMPYYTDPFNYVIANPGDTRNYWNLIWRFAEDGDLDIYGNQIPYDKNIIDLSKNVVFKVVPNVFNKNEFYMSKELIESLKKYTFIPQDIITDLLKFDNKSFATKGAFENDLSNVIGKMRFKKYKKYFIETFKTWLSKDEADYILNDNIEFPIIPLMYIKGYNRAVYGGVYKHMNQPIEKKISNQPIGKVVGSSFVFNDFAYSILRDILPINLFNKLKELNNITYKNIFNLESAILSKITYTDFNKYRKDIINNLYIIDGDRKITDLKMEIYLSTPDVFKKNGVNYALKSFIFSEMTDIDKNMYELHLMKKKTSKSDNTITESVLNDNVLDDNDIESINDINVTEDKTVKHHEFKLNSNNINRIKFKNNSGFKL